MIREAPPEAMQAVGLQGAVTISPSTVGISSDTVGWIGIARYRVGRGRWRSSYRGCYELPHPLRRPE